MLRVKQQVEICLFSSTGQKIGGNLVAGILRLIMHFNRGAKLKSFLMSIVRIGLIVIVKDRRKVDQMQTSTEHDEII